MPKKINYIDTERNNLSLSSPVRNKENFHRVCASDILEDAKFSNVNQLFDDVVKGLLELIESSETTSTVSISLEWEHGFS